jgi:hypothetical protein
MVLALPLAACTGDLGRPRPTIWNQLVAPEIGFWSATVRGEAASYFRMTDDELQLRDRAWRLIMPAHEKSYFAAEVSALAHARIVSTALQPSDVAAYYAALTSGSYASQVSRYSRLAEDATADRLLITPFRGNAQRVVAADKVRLRTLETSPLVPPEKQDPALARVIENEGLVLWVCERVGFRLESYRYALANLMVEMPSREAIKVERAIMALEAEIGPLCKMQLHGIVKPPEPVVAKG